jgi:uncharacterized membrane protein
MWAGAWRVAAGVAALVVYALLSNWLMVHAADHAWTVGLLFGPLLLGLAAMGCRKRQWWTLAACVGLLALLAVVVWRGGVLNAQRLYLLQHAALHLAIGWSFAMTLRGAEKPLITALAELVHGRLGHPFTPALALYTRAVTALWVGYFVGMVALSVLIYAWAPWSWWSLFCTVLTPLSVALLFVAEHLWREWRHPEFPRVSMQAIVQAYRRSGQEVGP